MSGKIFFIPFFVYVRKNVLVYVRKKVATGGILITKKKFSPPPNKIRSATAGEYIYILRSDQERLRKMQQMQGPLEGIKPTALREDLVLHFSQSFLISLKMYIYSLGLQTLTTAF
jgi:hypothetical protein